MIDHLPGDEAGKAAGEIEYLYVAGVAYLLFLLSVTPCFCVSLIDLAAEWQAASRGDATDPAQHVAMASMALVAAGLACVCFLFATVVSLHVLWRGSRGQRLRIAAWYGGVAVILTVETLGPKGADFAARFDFSLYQTLLMLPPLVLPVAWLWRDRWHYVSNSLIP